MLFDFYVISPLDGSKSLTVLDICPVIMNGTVQLSVVNMSDLSKSTGFTTSAGLRLPYHGEMKPDVKLGIELFEEYVSRYYNATIDFPMENIYRHHTQGVKKIVS